MLALMVVPLLIGVLAGYALGGRLAWLASHQIRAAWLLWLAAALQLVHFQWRSARHAVESWTGVSLMVPIFALVGAWVLVNVPRRTRALQVAAGVILLGGAMNLAAILANGRMPVSGSVVRAASTSAQQQPLSPKHLVAGEQSRLVWLGDIVPIAPINTVISAGDIVLLLGVAGFVVAAMREPTGRRRATVAGPDEVRSRAMTDELKVAGVPFPLVPSAARLWRVDEESGTVAVTAEPHTDIFIDPAGDAEVNAESMLNAATLLGPPPAGDFQFSARVTVDFAATYDAGVLLLWLDERHWGKLCFEYSPAGEPMIVSVVCRGVADDANAFVVPDRTVWLRVSRLGGVYAYHASLDGETWQMIRAFVLTDDVTAHRIGFEGQSPTGDGCAVTFDDISFRSERLTDLRDGS